MATEYNTKAALSTIQNSSKDQIISNTTQLTRPKPRNTRCYWL